MLIKNAAKPQLETGNCKCLSTKRDSVLQIGICTAPELRVVLHGNYRGSDGNIHSGEMLLSRAFMLEPENEACFFDLYGVAIGKGFHWQATEKESFKGALECKPCKEGFTAVNHIDLEEYLISVISSEMSAEAPLELLKAQAVVARSWAMRQVAHKHKATNLVYQDENCYIRRYENDSHSDFDLCADDHCQRYYGISRATNPNVELAVKATAGEVLMHNGEICDARYHKSCGGITELYSTCWDDKDYDYLRPVRDCAPICTPANLQDEAAARAFILSNPPAFCNSASSEIGNSLNSFDAGINGYRWKVEYSQKELSELIYKKSGFDFGDIVALEPVSRGPSGRISKLRVIGSRKSLIVGKELEIRKWLSESHLYSSAFVVEHQGDKFTLHGAGWGHGVGMCQTGAAAMALQGYNYRQILEHYYANAKTQSVFSLA